jgi:HPt (histidine-containing phosphotransfer) domain-containing protein
MDNKGYDLNKVAEHIGLDIETMEMLLGEFFNAVDEEMVLLEKAVKERDGEMVTHVSHKMKGASANMMVEPLRTYMETMQKMDKADYEEMDNLFEKSKKTYSEFREHFRK